MKKLEITNTHYVRLLEAFRLHLETLNYAKSTVYNDTNMVKEYIHFLQKDRIDLRKTDSKTISNYVEYLKTRPNQRRDGGLSIAYLKKHISALKRFYDYLHLSGHYSTTLVFPVFRRSKTHPKVLSISQIKQLFAVCDDSLLGKRNKAILAIYYGCGLRRKEGINLMIEDVDLHKEEVLIQNSKTYRQRIVPMSSHVQTIIEDYLFNVREKLVPDDKSTTTLLVSNRGTALSSESVAYIVCNLVLESKIKIKATPHTLRHSIATHLLHSGMKLENIALFLGHKSIDSTQIYTHIKHQD